METTHLVEVKETVRISQSKFSFLFCFKSRNKLIKDMVVSFSLVDERIIATTYVSLMVYGSLKVILEHVELSETFPKDIQKSLLH